MSPLLNNTHIRADKIKPSFLTSQQNGKTMKAGDILQHQLLWGCFMICRVMSSYPDMIFYSLNKKYIHNIQHIHHYLI